MAMEQAIVAGGCFWCTEAIYLEVKGVERVESGYSGGHVPNPTYEQVCGKKTGHAEVVQVEFDPAELSFADLLRVFFTIHDPTTKDRQFCDGGSQYRTGIFVHDAEQKRIAEASKAALEKNKPFSGPIVTEITQASTFYPAEDYHQDYYIKNPARYTYYRTGCGRDKRLKSLWGELPKP